MNKAITTTTYNHCVAEMSIHYNVKVDRKTLPIIDSAHAFYKYVMMSKLFGQINHREEFLAVFLDKKNRIIGSYRVGMGGIDSTAVDARLIYQAALLCNSSSIIITHNHPTGYTLPSDVDKRITRVIKEGCKLLNLNLFDHIIVGEDGYTSFANEGIL